MLSANLFPSFSLCYGVEKKKKKRTVNSMEGLRSNHNGSRGLMNINDDDDDDDDESIPFAAFILSIPLAPGWLVSGKMM